MPQSQNDVHVLIVELTVLACSWLIMTFAAQYCLLADTFGNNMFFVATDAVTTYLMHLFHAKIAFSLVRAYLFSQPYTLYVGLPQMTRTNLYELFAIINCMVLIVTYF